MKSFTNKSENKLSIMLSSIKISIIIFSSVIIYVNIPENWNKLYSRSKFGLFSPLICLFIILAIILISKLANYKVIQTSNKFRVSWLIENIFFISVIFLPMHFSIFYTSQYKYLFLLLIISSAIQYGSYYGIITAILSSVLVLITDLVYEPNIHGVNLVFQSDLIMVGIFIFIAWILGYYIDMEAKNNKKKEDTLNMLSSELEEKDKQRKEMESVLLKNRICYDMLIENSLNAVIVHRSGKIIYTNESAIRLLGYKNLTNLYGKNFYDYYNEKLKPAIQKRYLKITHKKLSKIINEENILKCSGEFIPVINTSSFFTYKGEPSVMTFLRDITSEKKVESLKEDIAKNLKLLNETREFNNLVTNFFTNMSHELKTPVNVLYAAIQTIKLYLNEYNLDNALKCKSYLKVMKQNCLRMIRLINNLLDITKLDSGFIKIAKKNGDIVCVVEEIVQSVASYVKSKDIELIFDTNVEEKIIAFDHDMMERIILNLISNAFKYSQPGGHIYVNLIYKKSNIIIKVKDEGDGIPKDKLNLIFERFGQVNSTLSRKCEGTGIGLYLVKSFVEMHEGKISIISKEGKGSEFSIVLPENLVNNNSNVDKAFFKTKVEKIEIEFSDIYSIKD